MKLMKTEDAVGQMLCHDITQIIRGVKKGPVFRKGHIITEEDVPVLQEKAAELGLHEVTRQVDNNWICLVLG